MRTIIGLFFLLFTSPIVFGQCPSVVRRVVVTYPVVVKPVHHYEHVKVVEVEVAREHYYSIDPYAQQNLLADAIVGRLLRLQAEGKVAPIKTRPDGGKPSGPAKDEPVSVNTDAPGQYQNSDTLKIVTNSCAKCHGPSSKYTKLVTSEGKLPDLPAGKIWECFALVNTGEMPKGGKSLSDDEVKLFYDWAKNARK